MAAQQGAVFLACCYREINDGANHCDQEISRKGIRLMLQHVR